MEIFENIDKCRQVVLFMKFYRNNNKVKFNFFCLLMQYYYNKNKLGQVMCGWRLKCIYFLIL